MTIVQNEIFDFLSNLQRCILVITIILFVEPCEDIIFDLFLMILYGFYFNSIKTEKRLNVWK